MLGWVLFGGEAVKGTAHGKTVSLTEPLTGNPYAISTVPDRLERSGVRPDEVPGKGGGFWRSTR